MLHDTDWNWRLEGGPGDSLRAVADIGSHWLDLTSFITGLRPQSVMADLSIVHPVRWTPAGQRETSTDGGSQPSKAVPIRTEDIATILIRYEGGAKGCLAISQVSPGRKNSLSFQIDGLSAAAAWDSEQPDTMWVGHRDRSNEIVMRSPGLLNTAGAAAAQLPGGHVEGFADTFSAGFAAIYTDILAGGPSANPPYATFAAGHQEMLVADAVLASARSARWASVASW